MRSGMDSSQSAPRQLAHDTKPSPDAILFIFDSAQQCPCPLIRLNCPPRRGPPKSAAFDAGFSHGVKLIDAAYKAHEEDGDVLLMITKHCMRFS